MASQTYPFKMSQSPPSNGGSTASNVTQRSTNLASLIYKDPTFNKNLVTTLPNITGSAVQSQTMPKPSSPQQTAEFVLKDANSSSLPQTSSPTGAKSPSAQPSPPPKMLEPIPRPIDIPMSLGVKLEIGVGLAAVITFFGVWVAMMAGRCNEQQTWAFILKIFVFLGGLTGLFVVVYALFEQKLLPRTGFGGCMFFSSVVIVACANVISLYLLFTCTCSCVKNIFSKQDHLTGSRDLIMFVFTLIATLCLFAVLLIGSNSSVRRVATPR